MISPNQNVWSQSWLVVYLHFYSPKLNVDITEGNKFLDWVLQKKINDGGSGHSHKKRKDSLEARATLLIFSLELEISGVAVQSMHQNSEKWQLLLETAQ